MMIHGTIENVLKWSGSDWISLHGFVMLVEFLVAMNAKVSMWCFTVIVTADSM